MDIDSCMSPFKSPQFDTASSKTPNCQQLGPLGNLLILITFLQALPMSSMPWFLLLFCVSPSIPYKDASLDLGPSLIKMTSAQYLYINRVCKKTFYSEASFQTHGQIRIWGDKNIRLMSVKTKLLFENSTQDPMDLKNKTNKIICTNINLCPKISLNINLLS